MQHEETRTAMVFAGLSAYETWMHYCNMGGCTDYVEFDAYLHGMLPLDTDDADLVSQSVNELLDDICSEEPALFRAPYSWLPSPSTAGMALPCQPRSGGDLRPRSGRPGVPLPSGTDAELLGHIFGDVLDGASLQRIVPSDN